MVRGWWQALAPRWRRVIAIGGAVFGAYVAAGFLVVPAIIKSQVRSKAPELLNRTALLEKARFNPFTLKTTLINFNLRDRDSTPLFAFDTLVVNLSALSIPLRAIVLDEFRLVRPAIVARLMQDGSPAIADLLEPDSAAAAAADSAPPEDAMPRLSVRHTALVEGRIAFVDESRSPAYQENFTDLSAEIDGFSTLPREEGDHDLSVQFAGGSRIDWSGTNTLRPLRLDGRFSILNMRLPRLVEVLAGTLPLQLTEGFADLTLEYQASRDSAGEFRVAIPDASVILSRLVVRERGDSSTDWLRVPKFAIRGVRASYPQRTARIGSVSVDSLWVAAEREPDGRLGWQRVLAMMPADTAAADTVAMAPWNAVIDTIELTNGVAELADRSNRPAVTLTVSDILVRLTNVSTDSTQRLGLAAGALVGGRGRFTMSGGAVRAPLNASFDLALQGLPVPLAQPYLGEFPPARLDSGAINLRGTVRMRNARPQTQFDGTASIDRLGISDSSGGQLLGWNTMAVRGIRLTTAPDLLRIRNITFERPFMRIAISREREFNFTPVMNAIPTDTTSAGFPYELLEIAINNGQIDFSDESLILPFRTLIDSTQGSIKDVASFGATPGSLEIAGRTGEAGSASASGRLHVNDPYASTDIQATFRNVALPTFTPYSAQFMGYAIRTGVLDLDLAYHIQNRQLRAEHHIVATNLNLGESVEGGESPGFLVKLALSLMKDSRGRITIDAPASGSVDDPQFSYRKIVWDAIKHVLGRVATAPFRFLGGLLGIGGEEPELIDFDPGRSVLLAPERVKLDTLAAELVRKPELLIAIEGRYDSTADESAVREQLLAARVQSKRDSLTVVARGDTSATVLAGILDVLYTEQFGRAAFDSLRARHMTAAATLDVVPYYAEVRRQLLAVQPVAPGFLPNLARERAAAIRTALLAGGRVDSTRVTVSEPAAASRKKTGSSRVASEMSMDAR